MRSKKMNKGKILQVFNNNYQDIFDIFLDTSKNLHDSVKFMNSDFKTVWANKSAVKYEGVTLEALKEKECYRVYYGFEEPCKNCPLIEAQKFFQPVKRELEFPDGIYTVRVYPTQIED